MIHARKDYNRIQDPALENPELLGEGSTPIGEDEPVFLLRARDKHFQRMLMFYALLVEEDNSPDMVSAVMAHKKLSREWQTRHGTKTPDMPTESEEK